MPTLTWSPSCFSIDGRPAPLISGEFHYFRVPRKDWRARLLLLKESGANAVATYVPWIIHEPEEGCILFDDIPERSLTEFLTLCTELGIMVIIRPGPYAYSELCGDGLPLWITEKHPALCSHGPHGEYYARIRNAAYLHPLFLEKARRYIRAVDEKIRPFLVTNGGCIVSVQADNEIGGIHVWRGFLDCNREAMGFGQEDGYYVRFLREKYGSVALLNERYGTSYASFTDILPFQNTPSDSTTGGKRFACDYRAFYKWTLEIYIQILCSWFREDGIDVDYCTNAGNSSFIPMLRSLPAQNAQNHFLLGVDHYYSLSPAMGISMTPEKLCQYQCSLDMLRELGMPPSVLEMQSGSASCYPPILPESLLGFYMAHVALGMKGSNYYVFTGGPNYADTGTNTEIYDYHAPVSATGEIRPLYHAQKERNEFSHEHSWLLTEERCCDLQLGFYWELADELAHGPWSRYTKDGLDLRALSDSLQLTMGLGGRLWRYCEIGGKPDVSVPMIVVCDGRMPREKQESLIRFVERGGRLLLTPFLPEYDEDFLPCTLLRDYLGVSACTPLYTHTPILLKSGEKVFDIRKKYTFPGFCGEALATDMAGGEVLIEYKPVGRGGVVLMGATYSYSQFCQMDMLDLCLDALGCRRRVETASRHLMATLFENGEKAVCFLLNSLPGAITTDLTVTANGKRYTYHNVTVPAMSVLPVQVS